MSHIFPLVYHLLWFRKKPSFKQDFFFSLSLIILACEKDWPGTHTFIYFLLYMINPYCAMSTLVLPTLYKSLKGGVHSRSTTELSLQMQLCVSSFAQSCLTLCDLVGSSPRGSSVHRILQAKTLEWVAMPSSRAFPDPGIEPQSLRSRALAIPLS